MAEQTISITINDERKEVDASLTGTELFAENKDIIAVRLNGEPRDLYTPLHDGDVVEPITLDSEDGLAIMRHSATHVMAQAVQEIRPDAKLGIGPVIKNGFYYDFDVKDPFTPEDLKEIEKRMQRIIKSAQSFRRRAVTEEEARAEEADQPYKLELIGDKEAALDPEAATEVSQAELSMYDNVDREGNTVWKDLCRGPHLPNTRFIKAFKLERVAAAYWRGSEKNPMLQRIYGTAWASKDDLKAYMQRMEEAAKRDHRKLGQEMDLFSFPEELGPGLAVFHPKGAAIINAMQDYSREMHRKHHYSFVQTPHITKGHLYEISGHLQWYKDGMYPPMRIDEEKDENGNIVKQGFDYYLKPMNCPMHNLIFRSRQRSYRELPLRLFEFGTVYRYEKSGVVHGLTRVRGLTQDDSHIYCTREQMRDELKNLLTFVLNLLKDFGLNDFYLELSTKDEHKFVGSDEIWEEATNTLAEVAKESGLELVADPGGAAFYGPKISVQARDAIGRTWQVSTIQLDFNLPERFGLEYIAADGTHQRPVMIHRALFGSIERFFAILLEHYAGAFPAWLAPVQVLGIPVADEFAPHLAGFVKSLEDEMVRCEIDYSDDRFGKKIRNASKSKVPFILIVGEEDMSKNAVSFRFRDGSQLNGVPVDQARAWILEAIAKRVQINTADDFKAAVGEPVEAADAE
ncbi:MULTISPECIES: threonine--tRNA ligase [Bifidobacterium]|uniref:Threonine--tRNA ligase n=1 Tax=Bifidobacterium pullorum subsp. gallinarum TaxID=78344 RepID=A0A921IWW2_9BIFI|nr:MULTISPECIES: threonine--tRNA ligase [Bifidobacterium]MBM6696424.1 threonine--tRNA ligase [Bifidobacterium pullorum subsp. saeculare]MBM6705964.1 threonine--tRNA ligase [Bifidobacterium pullorum subsp. saeculare]MBM6729639.1 threonine--tRNA ligase [Bifidobacterium pullorum subsp. saeculare]MBS5400419.1 threonine--tRNA ligase [Bifidobacterium sp.]HJG41275.1 threonine--tRNA ligase [Bifidobacterium pullorum subsp. gallinarum]